MGESMKKLKMMLGIVFFAIVFAGCGKKESVEELLPASQEKFSYLGTAGINRIAVDEDGLLYTVTSIIPEYGDMVLAEEYVFQPVTHRFCLYNLDGVCTEQIEIELGSGSVQEMLIQNGILYCVINSENMEATLYAIKTDTWEVVQITALAGYTSIFNMVYIDEYIYFCGIYEQTASKEYQLHPDVMNYYYRGEQICRVNVKSDNPRVELMSIDFPIAICGKNETSILIYRYTEENGFGFLEYNHAEGSLAEAGWKNTATQLLNFSGCGEGYLFTKEGNLYYGTVNGTEAQIYPERISITSTVISKKGFIFYMNSREERKVERICIANVIHDNKEIKLLMHNDTMDKPYGCGFRMDKIALSEEQCALKILAQDKDYDVCLLSTNQPCSYNIKENGAFYSLNDIEGVQDYIDACFPYVKEVATNSDGDIWMLPVALAIPGIVYNKEYCEKNMVDFSHMDFYEWLSFTKQIEAVQPFLTSVSSYVISEEFFGRYLENYNTFDTGTFRKYLELLRLIYQEQGEWSSDIGLLTEMTSENIPDFYYLYERYSYGLSLHAQRLGNSDTVGIMGIPGIIEEGNIGTITFLAVNPQSENLEDSLAYISAFSKYMLEKKNSFMLSDESTYTNTPFFHDWYRLYADGNVNFAMDSSVYWETYGAYISGKCELEEAIREMERKLEIYTGE